MLLPLRPRPQPDELLTSWLVRLAWANARKLHPFCRDLFGGRSHHWYRDLDVSCSAGDLGRIATATGVPPARVEEATFRTFEGVVFEQLHARGPTPWVMRMRHVGRARLAHGQQMCWRCLRDDASPYFRRHWRLAFSVVCRRHDVLLSDACLQCSAPISYHEGDYGLIEVPRECSITTCKHCGFDQRRGDHRHRSPIDPAVVDLQARIEEMVEQGYSLRLPGGTSYAALAFAGMQRILRVLAANGRVGRLREHLLRQRGELALNIPGQTNGMQFWHLRLADRYGLLHQLAELLEDWPRVFVDSCRAARLSYSYIHPTSDPLPYWLHQPIRLELWDRYYAPNDEERKAVRHYLERHRLGATENDVRRWLGVSHNSSLVRASARPAQQWNPRRFSSPKS